MNILCDGPGPHIPLSGILGESSAAVTGMRCASSSCVLVPPPPVPTEQSALFAATRILIAPTVRTLDAQPALAELVPLFAGWVPGETVKIGDMKSYDGTVVECVQAHTTQTGWEPPVVPALWKTYRNPGDAWVQPLGSSDAYPLGAVVEYGGQSWRATLANNVWQPGVAGWVQI